MMERVLLIDDDVELCDLVTEYLEGEGLKAEAVYAGEPGVTRALSGDYGIVVIDVMLPGIGGFEVLRRIRARSQVPVLILSARGEEIDRIVGLELGADDYLPKPFNSRELVARIRAILRRTKSRPERESPIRIADVELDPSARVVHRGGARLELTSVEFELLERLMASAGSVVSREDLVTSVLGRIYNPLDRSIDMHVSNIRRKLGTLADGSERIKTVRAVGYIYSNTGEPDRF